MHNFYIISLLFDTKMDRESVQEDVKILTAHALIKTRRHYNM